MIITLDGFSCQGKSHFAKKISEQLEIGYFSTGLIFRFVTWTYANLSHVNPTTNVSVRLEEALEQLDQTDLTTLQSMKELKESKTEKYLKEVSMYHTEILPRLQKRLFEYLRDKSMVLDGRFTFQIFPNALRKYYFKSTIEDRANLLSSIKGITLEEATSYIQYRDSFEKTFHLPNDVKVINPFLFTEETLLEFFMQDIKKRG